MHTRTQQLFLQGTMILLGALVVSTVGGWARGVTAEPHGPPPAAGAFLSEIRGLRQDLIAREGELDVIRLQLERATAVIAYSGRYVIPADLAGAIYDIALSEGLTPDVAFPLVELESRFNPRARSAAGAVGLTQVLPTTARLYEPGLTLEQLYDRDTNLRLGFRYLRDLLDRYDGDHERALLAYNRGPARVQELLNAGRDPRNGYAEKILRARRTD
jgi:soluble lytic murein transglycosylase-like protein